MSDHIRPLECGPLANQPHRAIQFVNPEDGGQLGTTYVEPLSMIIRPSTGMAAHASVFVDRSLVHVPREDAPAIASVLCNAAGCTRAEVLTALGAVDKADFDKAVALSEQRQSELEELGLNPWKARCQEVRNKLAEAEATIERVKAVHHDFYKVRGDWADEHGARALKQALDAALTPPKPFELPTEAGARFEACYGTEWETYTTYSDGSGNAIYRGDAGFNDGGYIMRCYTDHRLLDGEA